MKNQWYKAPEFRHTMNPLVEKCLHLKERNNVEQAILLKDVLTIPTTRYCLTKGEED